MSKLLNDLAKLLESSKHELVVFDRDTKTLKSVEWVSINGNTVQLNVERFEDDKKIEQGG